MRERLREAIQVWARQHPAFGPHVHADEIDELASRIEGLILAARIEGLILRSVYAQVPKEPE